MHQAFEKELWLIANQKEIEQSWKKENDENCIFKFYDTNKAMRVLQATLEGRAIGTCIKENTLHYLHLINKGYKPTVFYAKYINITDDPDYKTKILTHQYIVLEIDGKFYYETRSNGVHKRFPLYEWRKKLKFIYIEKPKPIFIKKDGKNYIKWEYMKDN